MPNAGVYAIRCHAGGVYVGGSINVEKRLREHRNALLRGDHCNKNLQAAWAKHGADSFEFIALESCAPSDVVKAEQELIRATMEQEACFNIKRNATNSLGRNCGYSFDWDAQPWAKETNTTIAHRLGVTHQTAARHRPVGIPSPSSTYEWRAANGRKGQAAQSIEQLRSSARKALAQRTAGQRAEICRMMRAAINPENQRRAQAARRANEKARKPI